MKHNRNGREDTVIKLTLARGFSTGTFCTERFQEQPRARADEIVRYEVPRNARGKKRRGKTRMTATQRRGERERERRGTVVAL